MFCLVTLFTKALTTAWHGGCTQDPEFNFAEFVPIINLFSRVLSVMKCRINFFASLFFAIFLSACCKDQPWETQDPSENNTPQSNSSNSLQYSSNLLASAGLKQTAVSSMPAPAGGVRLELGSLLEAQCDITFDGHCNVTVVDDGGSIGGNIDIDGTTGEFQCTFFGTGDNGSFIGNCDSDGDFDFDFTCDIDGLHCEGGMSCQDGSIFGGIQGGACGPNGNFDFFFNTNGKECSGGFFLDIKW